MKKVLIFAAVAEAATGLALLIVPSLVGQLLLGERIHRRRNTGSARGRHRPDWLWGSLAGLVRRSVGMLTYSAARRAVSCLFGFAVGWRRPSVAGGRRACVLALLLASDLLARERSRMHANGPAAIEPSMSSRPI